MRYEKYPNYDPSVSARLEECKARWESYEETRGNLIKYGIKFLDTRLFGIDTVDGELNLIIGEEKMRKTTLLINIIVNIMTAESERERPVTVIDTLESGMTPMRYTNQLVSNLASRYLMELGHVPATHGVCPVCNDDSQCRELRISPEFLNYMPRFYSS